MSSFNCPSCGGETHYRMFSGGREFYCPGCGCTGDYPDDAPGLPRATLLRNGEAGVTALRAQMDQELARLHDEADPSVTLTQMAPEAKPGERVHTIDGPHYDTVGHNPNKCLWDIPHCGPCWPPGEPKPANPWARTEGE